MSELSGAFLNLVKIMDDLREKCPWDKKQTIHSLRSLTIEETYELADAIIQEDYKGIKEELGDLLLHILFYSKIGSEQQAFTLQEVIETISEKLIHRHPHIYGDVKVENDEEVKQNWEKLKRQEGKKSLLEGVPNSLPAMVKALRMQDKTRQVGFEWKHIDQVWDKVEEEMGELKSAVDSNASINEIELELGDVFFALINYARFLKLDPETALEKVNQKFKNRFQYIEQHAGKPLDEMSLEEMDVLWNEAKSITNY
ncbi:MAG: nucleoside triphosphate pyrophosphohydrolase [Saprospiraceae bacterium]|nr:nucleoside triphosphate pyrophosphohydrolase [Saprospiraceae bacterium]MBK7736750.1 nucleoside triphosphate pyrophosphohydrolase [Saprospiraceae bacterium]MBK7911887.1 nucleoside triphosphate pyrophosphohydrolase [Saprospiraceae bacterium]